MSSEGAISLIYVCTRLYRQPKTTLLLKGTTEEAYLSLASYSKASDTQGSVNVYAAVSGPLLVAQSNHALDCLQRRSITTLVSLASFLEFSVVFVLASIRYLLLRNLDYKDLKRSFASSLYLLLQLRNRANRHARTPLCYGPSLPRSTLSLCNLVRSYSSLRY